MEILRHFNYIVGYQAGNKNTAADALSHRPDHMAAGLETQSVPAFAEDKMVPVELLAISANDFLEPGSRSIIGDTLWWALLQTIDTDATFMKEIKEETKPGDPQGEDGKIWVPNQKDLQ